MLYFVVHLFHVKKQEHIPIECFLYELLFLSTLPNSVFFSYLSIFYLYTFISTEAIFKETKRKSKGATYFIWIVTSMTRPLISGVWFFTAREVKRNWDKDRGAVIKSSDVKIHHLQLEKALSETEEGGKLNVNCWIGKMSHTLPIGSEQ